jgi:hypothetical protein
MKLREKSPRHATALDAPTQNRFFYRLVRTHPAMPDERLDQIRSKLTNQDRQTLRVSVGLELEKLQLNSEVFAGYERLRAQARDARAQIPNAAGAKSGVRCSFCQKHVSEVGHVVKLSDSHVICDLCIEFLVDSVRREG